MYILQNGNLTISDRNLINDSCFKGAYILKNYIDLIDRVEGMSYFVGSDRVSEYYDTEELLFGGTGLLTKDGIQKPAMFAFHFSEPSLFRICRERLSLSCDKRWAWKLWDCVSQLQETGI